MRLVTSSPLTPPRRRSISTISHVRSASLVIVSASPLAVPTVWPPLRNIAPVTVRGIGLSSTIKIAHVDGCRTCTESEGAVVVDGVRSFRTG